MNGRDIERASSADHLALGTVIGYGDGHLVILIDHLEEAPTFGQRVTVTAGWDDTDLGESPENTPTTKPEGDHDG